MKIKELPTTVVSAWSPKAHLPLTIAMGTAAQQLDASFSTSSNLELYTIKANELTLSSSISTDCRFHKLVWGAYGIYNEWNSGIIAGGCDNGKICLYNASKLALDVDSLITTSDRHVGSVKALDFNLFQTNLLATGASESEIFIWDLFNMSSPMTPGSKSDNFEDVIDLAWNNEVQHILGSLFHKHTVVWDLRKNEPILKLTDDNNTKLRWKSMAWNPNVATQLCIASEDDQYPVIQLWDLRYASSPIKNLIGHQKGILSISWCSHDANLLISCGKDNRICLWNPSSESDENLLLCHLEHERQWNFEVNWCPRDPLLLETSSFDGITTFYSLNNLQSVQNYQMEVAGNLNYAPRWLRRNCKASFAFGGNLVSLDGSLKTVQINKTITEPEMIVWSENLRKILSEECYDTFFNQKCETTTNTNIQQTWEFIRSMFQEKPQEAQLKILGYSVDYVTDVPTELQNGNNSEKKKIENNLSPPKPQKFYESEIASTFENLTVPTSDLQIKICNLLLIGNKAMAADILFDNGNIVEAMLLAYNSDSETLSRIQNKFFKTTEGLDAALLYTIVIGDWQNFAENCNLRCWKQIMAAILTYTSGQMFVSCMEKLGSRLAADPNYSQYAKLCFISCGNIEAFIDNTDYFDSVTKLQECVEITLILHKSLMPSESNVLIGKNFNDLLVKYSECLVSQGDLIGALEFLKLTNNSQGIELKNQVHKALGINQVEHYSNQPSQKKTSLHDLRKYSTSSATGTITPEPPFPSYPNKVLPGKEMSHNNLIQSNMSYSSQHQSMYGLDNSQQTRFHSSPVTLPPQIGSSHYNQTCIPTNRIPLTPPLNNDCSRSITPSGLKSGKPKYVVDPSVKGNTYGVYNNNSGGMPPLNNSYNQSQNMLSNQLGQFNNSNNLFQPNNFNQSNDQTHNFLNPSMSQIEPTNLIQPLAQYPQYVNQSVNTGQTLNLNSSIPNFQPNQFQSNNIAQPAIPTASTYNHPSSFNSTTTPVNPLLNNYIQKSTPAGWNDPPMLSNSTVVKQKPQTPVPSAPITHPLYTDNPPPIQEIGTYIPLQSEQSCYKNTSECTEALPKLPIPPEHIRIKHILEAIQSCVLDIAPNAQNKKRICDISKKIEILYDSLRENSLSPYCTQSLHTILDMTMQRNYNEAFNILTQLISGPEFSKISSFIPSIKTLLQMAQHYNINLEGI